MLAFTVGAVTKALWLWELAINGIAFAQGAFAVATGNLTGALLEIPAAAKGAQAAMAFMNNGGVILSRTLTGIAAALILINKNQIEDWANDSSLGRAYNNFSGNADETKQSILRQYKKDPNAAKAYIADHPQFNTPDIQKSMDSIDKDNQVEAIEKRQSEEYKDELIKSDKNNNTQNHIHLNVNIDKSGNVSVESSGNARVTTPSIGSTWPLN